uniref:Uncharacterized protein n=1 Tax=Trichogramma kaykai TaxID=54128 RepID=A0ABD2X528_9HYME
MRMCSSKTASRAHGISYYTRSIHSGDFCSRSSRKRFSHTRDCVKFGSPYCYYYLYEAAEAPLLYSYMRGRERGRRKKDEENTSERFDLRVLCIRPMKRLLFIEGAVCLANRISMAFLRQKTYTRIRRPVRK